MNSLLLQSRNIALVFAFVSAPAISESDYVNSDVSAYVAANSAPITAATVILEANNIATAAIINENQLRRSGCNYKVTDAGSITSLLKIISDSKIVTHPHPGYYRHGVDYRIGVYLHRIDNSEDTFLFEDQGAERALFGTYNRTVTVQSTNPGFATQLRAWAAGRTSTKEPCWGRESGTPKK